MRVNRRSINGRLTGTRTGWLTQACVRSLAPGHLDRASQAAGASLPPAVSSEAGQSPTAQGADGGGTRARHRLGNLESATRLEVRVVNLGGVMTQSVQNYPGLAGSNALAAQRNRVLRNTYWLLALSMVPTVLGAWVGVQTGMMAGLSGGLGIVVFLAGAFGFMFAIEKFKNSAAGVPILLAFTFFMGLMLSRLVGAVLGLNNGASLIMTAFAGTGAIFFGMASLSTIIKRDLGAMGKFLFIGAIMLLVAMVANIFIQSSALMITLSVLAIGIFSAFILYDLKRVQDGQETNYITATLGVYLSLYNVFSNLLALLGIFCGERD
jgi:modulator of FtsH protease